MKKQGMKFCSAKCRNKNPIPSRQKEQVFVSYLKRFNLNLDDYQEMFLSQDGKCAICHSPETMVLNGKVKRLAIDHCHITGMVRGLLCSRCNSGLGYFNDNWVLLDNALEYLTKGDLKAGINQRWGNRNVNA
jgi:hypothetical protein